MFRPTRSRGFDPVTHGAERYTRPVSKAFIDVTDLEMMDAREVFTLFAKSPDVESAIPREHLPGGVSVRMGAGQELTRQFLVTYGPDAVKVGGSALFTRFILPAIETWWKKKTGKDLKPEDMVPIYRPDGSVAVRVPKPPD